MFTEESYQEGYEHGKASVDSQEERLSKSANILALQLKEAGIDVHAKFTEKQNKNLQDDVCWGLMNDLSGISDGYHTFQELYDMRLALTVGLFSMIYQWRMLINSTLIPNLSLYRSKLHSDGTMFEGMFIVLLSLDYPNNTKWISFHYHDEHWDKFHMCQIILRAPIWDGHTDKDVIERLLSL